MSTRTALSIAGDSGKTTLSVVVKDPAGAAVTEGTVSFVSNGLSLGSAFVQADGTAALTLDRIPAAAKQITAVYSGAGQYGASSSAPAAIQAEDTTGLPDFAVAVNPSSLSLNAGDFGTVIVSVTPENGFNQSVTLALAGLPTTTTSYRFTPSIVTPTSTAAVTSTLQIQTTASSTSTSAQNHGSPLRGLPAAWAFVLPGAAALAGLGALGKGRGNGLRLMGAAILLLVSASGLTACSQRYGYLHHPPTANTGTPPGTYNVTLTAYSNSGGEVTSHSLQLTLTVK